MTTVKFIFHNYLREMLHRKYGSKPSFLHHFERRASIKDVIESLGVPHPLVGKLTVNGKEVGFDHILIDRDSVEASPLTPPVNPLVATKLRPQPLKEVAFFVDVNVGKLALLLRMLGFDAIYSNDLRNGRLAELAASGGRILLTRDTSLLKRKIVMHGYLPREEVPSRQLIEVLHLYDLNGRVKPLTRCMVCNGLLVPVDKARILERLEPLTKKYFDTFRICKKCGNIYWPGSHQEKMSAKIKEILAAVPSYDTSAG